jgi:methylated-DNA-protein-cysteine methyltransferase-like protein
MVLIGKLKIDPPIKRTSNFKENVIKITQQIPYGRVTTYGTIATLAGTPRGARIVGGILHYFSQEFNLPWQRVVNRHGFISTRCEGHTKQDQKEILEEEGVVVSDDFMVDLEQYGWWGEK